MASGSPAPLLSGFRLLNGDDVNVAIAQDRVSWANALVATGNNQGTGLQLTALFNHLGTVAASTGVCLPPAIPGTYCEVYNAGANTVAIYSSQSTPSDTIDGTAGTTGTTLTAAHRGATFFCFVAGAWVSSLFGAVSS